MMTLTPPGGETMLLAFTSCQRFNGRFYLRPKSIEVVLDTEGLALAPGETWELEEFLFTSGPNRAALLARLADRIDQNHPPLRFPAPPAGWCSWYCFGPRVTAKNVLDNLDVIAKDAPAAQVRPDRRRLSARHGRLAGDRQGLRRRRAGRAPGDPQAGLRAGHLGGARSSPRPARTSSSSIPTGS